MFSIPSFPHAAKYIFHILTGNFKLLLSFSLPGGELPHSPSPAYFNSICFLHFTSVLCVCIVCIVSNFKNFVHFILFASLFTISVKFFSVISSPPPSTHLFYMAEFLLNFFSMFVYLLPFAYFVLPRKTCNGLLSEICIANRSGKSLRERKIAE